MSANPDKKKAVSRLNKGLLRLTVIVSVSIGPIVGALIGYSYGARGYNPTHSALAGAGVGFLSVWGIYLFWKYFICMLVRWAIVWVISGFKND